ncbi:MAG: arginine--tRNA ligase, partial [Patescibacteria group bacterium]
GKKLVKTLLNKKIARMSEGATIIDLEQYNLGVWVLLRSDGTVLYSTKDLALAEEKFKKHKIDTAIYVVGNAQSLHLQQLFKTLELMKFKQAKNCHHVPVYEVRLPTGKMSSRTGDNILYSDFKKELTAHMKEEIKKRSTDLSEKELDHRSLVISIAALKYSMLKQDAPRPIVFVKEEALRFEGDTGPYLLYTYARFHSILTKGGYHTKKTIKTDYSFEQEKHLLTLLATFPHEVSKAAAQYNPSVIARYAYSLAKMLNEYYHAVPILKASEEERTARMALIDATLRVLKQSLTLLGITTLENM